MKVFWTIHTDTKKEKNAAIIFNKVAKKLMVDSYVDKFVKHPEDNHQIIYFYSIHDISDWKYLIYDILINAEQIGRVWQLFGSISFQCDGLSRDSSIPGIVQMEFFVDPNDYEPTGQAKH
jgi:hypothetical protein